MASFMIHLFVRPRCRNFYYGDYYGNQYAGLGFSPWYQRSFANHRGYDPALSFYRWDSHRHGVDFDRSVATWHQRYESNSSIRPPRMIQDQAQFLARHHGDRAAELAVMGHRFDDAVKSPRAGESFHRMDRHDIDLLRQNSQVNHSLESARRQHERESHGLQSGHHQPGNVVDLRQKDARGPAGGKADSNHVNSSPAHREKLVLTDQPARLKERTQDSAAHVERVRHHGNSNDQLAPAPVGHRAKSAVNGTVGNDRAVNDTLGNRADHTNLRGVSGNPDAANRLSENRQHAAERRQTRDMGNSNERTAPTPDATHHRTPQTNHRVPQHEGAVHERVARDRTITPHIDNSAPVMRHQPVEHAPRQIERHVPVEHAPQHIERAPAQHAPRHIERAPAQHHAPVERAPRSEGNHPHRKGHS